ncbi:unnamed protein product, partial [Amoebophrya sp. A120]
AASSAGARVPGPPAASVASSKDDFLVVEKRTSKPHEDPPCDEKIVEDQEAESENERHQSYSGLAPRGSCLYESKGDSSPGSSAPGDLPPRANQEALSSNNNSLPKPNPPIVSSSGLSAAAAGLEREQQQQREGAPSGSKASRSCSGSGNEST